MNSQIRAELVQLQDLTKTLHIMISFMKMDRWVKLHNDFKFMSQETWQRAS